MSEELEDKVTDLEFKLDDIQSSNEEIQIDINIILEKMKEENDRASKHDDSPYDLGQWNIYQVEEIKKLINKLII
jgi:hypothetical protein